MQLMKMDPQLCRNKMLVIRCQRNLDYYVPGHPAGADGVLAYCYLDPMRGYRLLLCAVIRTSPFAIFDECYMSTDVSYHRLGGENAKLYTRPLSTLSPSLQRLVYEVNKETLDHFMLQLSRMELDGWKVTRIGQK